MQLLEDNEDNIGLSEYTAQRLSLLKVMPKRQQIAIKAMLTPIAVDTIYELSNDIVQSMNVIYNIKISQIEKEGICDFLSAIYQVLYQKPIGVLVISHGSCIAKEMVRFINPTEKDKFRIEALDYGYEESSPLYKAQYMKQRG